MFQATFARPGSLKNGYFSRNMMMNRQSSADKARHLEGWRSTMKYLRSNDCWGFTKILKVTGLSIPDFWWNLWLPRILVLVWHSSVCPCLPCGARKIGALVYNYLCISKILYITRVYNKHIYSLWCLQNKIFSWGAFLNCSHVRKQPGTSLSWWIEVYCGGFAAVYGGKLTEIQMFPVMACRQQK